MDFRLNILRFDWPIWLATWPTKTGDESIVNLGGRKSSPRKRLLNMRATTSEVLVMSFPLVKVSFTAREYR